MYKKSLRKSRRKPCVYGVNQYGCCNKKSSIKKLRDVLKPLKEDVVHVNTV